MRRSWILGIIALLCIVGGCSKKHSEEKFIKDQKVKITTNYGDITVRLYKETPKHTENFLKLVQKNYYDSLLFHRVINEFMIQTGDPHSKGAMAGVQLGDGGPGYRVPAEFNPNLFHKKGALAAARLPDTQNPKQESDGSQFYIVTGKVYTEEDLLKIEDAKIYHERDGILSRLLSERRDSLTAYLKKRDAEGFNNYQELLKQEALQEAKKNAMKFSDEAKQVYTTLGGTPLLDNAYTVFGEVVEGMAVVDSISKAKCDSYDRPLNDVVILKTEILKETKDE